MLCLKVKLNNEAAQIVGIEKARFLQFSVLYSPDLDENPSINAIAQNRETPEFRVTKNWYDHKDLKVGDSVQIEVVESENSVGGEVVHRQGRRVAGNKTEIYCNWCGKSDEQVKRIISGPDVYICNECVQLCNDILADEGNDG